MPWLSPVRGEQIAEELVGGSRSKPELIVEISAALGNLTFAGKAGPMTAPYNLHNLVNPGH